eukprot:2040753-Rhodomonas_salina.1
MDLCCSVSWCFWNSGVLSGGNALRAMFSNVSRGRVVRVGARGLGLLLRDISSACSSALRVSSGHALGKSLRVSSCQYVAGSYMSYKSHCDAAGFGAVGFCWCVWRVCVWCVC